MKPIVLRRIEVRALLDKGEAVMVRKIKPQPEDDPSSSMPWVDDGPTPSGAGRCGHSLRLDECPHGKPGEQMWVRESARVVAVNGTHYIDYSAGGVRACEEIDMTGEDVPVACAGTFYGIANSEPVQSSETRTVWPWKRFGGIPRWASRLTVTVRAVTVEQHDGVWYWAVTLERNRT